VFGAETATAEAPADATLKAFSLANSRAVALPCACSLETLALRLARPSLCYPSSHLSTRHQKHHDKENS